MLASKLLEEAKIPTRKHPTDAGADLYSAERVVIPAHSMRVVRTGITIELPAGTMGLVMPKSRNNHLVGAGVVDAEYQGEIYIKVVNTNTTELIISVGEAIAQLVVVPILTPSIYEVEPDKIHVNKTVRGATGGIVPTDGAGGYMALHLSDVDWKYIMSNGGKLDARR